MKKLVCVLSTIVTVAVVFAAARPSLDGRAVVAESGAMPKGLFARTIGYLPGDSVTVTNPATGKTVDVLILGSIDPSEGVAILLSNEAGEVLSIKKDSNIQVKITKRAGSLDESVSGSAVLDENDAVAMLESDVPVTEEAEEESFEISEIAEEEAPQDQSVEEAVASVDEETVLPENDVEEDVTKVDDEAIASYEEEVPSESVVVDDLTDEAADSEVVYEAITVLPEEDNNIEESTEEVVIADSVIEDTPVENAVTVEDAIAVEDAVTIEETVEEVASAENETVTEEAPVIAESEPKVEVEVAVEEEYAPIILIPADANPPVPEDVKRNTVAAVEEVKKDEAPVVEVKKSTASVKGYDSYIVSSLKDLKKKSYYVQIATLGSDDNIKSVLSRYGDKYPFALVPLSSGTAYQVMVGPLNIDEYGTVVERFKSYGYKDCFLRKIK